MSLFPKFEISTYTAAIPAIPAIPDSKTNHDAGSRGARNSNPPAIPGYSAAILGRAKTGIAAE